jgi:hypothetical protein
MKNSIHPAVIRELARYEGFVTEALLPRLPQEQPLLIRASAHREIAKARDVPARIRCIEATGQYIRDVSMPAGDPAWPAIEEARQLL